MSSFHDHIFTHMMTKTDWTDVDWEIPRICEHKQYDPTFLKEIQNHSVLYGKTIKITKHNLLIFTNPDKPIFICICDISTPVQFKTRAFLWENAYDDLQAQDYIINKLRIEGFSESSLDFMKSIKVRSSSVGKLETLGFQIPPNEIFIKEYDPYYRWAVNN